MEVELKPTERERMLAEVEQYIKNRELTITASDFQRPWGGFFVIDEKEATRFINIFFPEEVVSLLAANGKLSPKILVVEPGKKLSWQYHLRRAEIWRVIRGSVGVAKSLTDNESTNITLSQGQEVRLAQGERYRLIGLSEWGVIAEIWQHTDAENPSDENDIIRLQDDFGR
jgi:mannose-6-phosphate isomerase